LGQRDRQKSRHGGYGARSLILFVIAHLAGNLKIFSGQEEINAYSRFLREAGWPELGYGQLLWIVRIVLLVCAFLHITAAIQLTRMNWQARPVDYESRRDVETTWAAVTMRWGGLLLTVFVVFHLFHFTGGLVGFQPGEFEHLMVYQNVVAGFPFGRYPYFISWQWERSACTSITASGACSRRSAGSRFITRKASGRFPESLQS